MTPEKPASATRVWDSETLWAIRGLVAVAHVNDFLVDRARPGWEDKLRVQLTTTLIDKAQPWGVVLHPDDVVMRDHGHPKAEEVKEGDDPNEITKFVARWQPRQRPVLLRGGCRDGKTVEMFDPWEVLTVNVPVYLEDSSGRARIWESNYSAVGWSERDRQWIHQAD
jgi:hypothetical protein